MLIWSSICKSRHHDLEFIEVYHTIPILIDFTNHFPPDAIIRVDVLAEDGCNLRSLYSSSTIFVEELESRSHVTLVEQLVLINCSGAPLSEVDCATTICVGIIKDGVCFFVHCLRVLIRVQLLVATEELSPLDQAITVLVPLHERLAQLLLLGFRGEVARHESKSRLLKLRLVLYVQMNKNSGY